LSTVIHRILPLRMNIFNKIKSEVAHNNPWRSSDATTSIKTLAETLKIAEEGKMFKGFIQRVQWFPYAVIMYCEEQLSIGKASKQRQWHNDVTGSLVQQLSEKPDCRFTENFAFIC
jgi:hypothetical protein